MSSHIQAGKHTPQTTQTTVQKTVLESSCWLKSSDTPATSYLCHHAWFARKLPVGSSSGEQGAHLPSSKTGTPFSDASFCRSCSNSSFFSFTRSQCGDSGKYRLSWERAGERRGTRGKVVRDETEDRKQKRRQEHGEIYGTKHTPRMSWAPLSWTLMKQRTGTGRF